MTADSPSTTAPATEGPVVDLHEDARAKLLRVLGTPKGPRVHGETMAEIGLERLRDANDLYRFAQLLIARGGFTGAVGGLLTVHALLHGARPPATEPPLGRA